MIQPHYTYNAIITKVVDGDTVDANIDLGFYVQAQVRLRLAGINAQETNDPDPVKRESGMKAKQYLSSLLTNKKVTLTTYKTDKYGRWLADIFLGVSNTSMSNVLINEGFAVPYEGGPRE